MSAESWIGEVFGARYEVREVIASGGMGHVFLAQDQVLGEAVALKVLKRRASAVSRRRFEREARLLGRISSARIVALRDFGFEGPCPFLVMDLLEGTDLGELLDEDGWLPTPQALAVSRAVCAALADVHAAGAVHRDLKPDNLVLVRDFDGTPSLKLIDFGIAKSGAEATLTRASSVVGTAAYMAPEQIRDAHDVDARADIWALGVMLYEMVCGQLPFPADNPVRLMTDILAGELLSPSLLAPISPALEAIILRCLAPAPEDRFEDVHELDAALAPLTLTGADLPAPRSTRARRAQQTTLPVTSDSLAA